MAYRCQTTAGRVTHEPGTADLTCGAGQRQDRGTVRSDLALQVEVAAGQHDADPVIADRSADQDLVTGLDDPFMEDGYVRVPDKPGLGVDLNYEGIEANLRPPSGLFEPTDAWNTPKLGFWQPDRRWDK